MSVYVQFAPFQLASGRTWATTRDPLATTVLRTLERYAPASAQLVEHRQVLTPVDLERSTA